MWPCGPRQQAARPRNTRAPPPPPRAPQLLPGARGLAPKVACGFRDPLCSLKSRFEFGSAVVGNTVYYSGGLDANNPTYPLPGSYLETIDLGGGAFAPRVLQAVPDAALNTSRYRHQLAPWRDGKIAVVGGQFDDRNGASQKCMSLIVLDLATREYELRRSFWQTNKGAPRLPRTAFTELLRRAAAGGRCRAGGGTRCARGSRPG